MSEIDWNKFDRAVSVHIKFYDKDERCIGFHRVARPRQKTVADAYEWTNGEWQEGKLAICELDGELNFSYNNLCMRNVTCNYKQFEAYAKEQEAKQEGEKWTHIHVAGDMCRVIASKPDKNGYIAVMWESGTYGYCKHDTVKPIKPKLTEDAMGAVERFSYSLMDKESYDLVSEVNSFRDAHEII